MQSGSALEPWATGIKIGEVSKNIGETMGCPRNLDSQALLHCLQKVDGRKLVATMQDYLQWSIFPVVFAPRVDGDFIPEDPAKMILEGRYKEVDLIAGVTREEGACMSQVIYAVKTLKDSLEVNFTTIGPISLQLEGSVAQEDILKVTKLLYHHYLGETINFDEAHSEALTKLYSDVHFMVGHDLTSHYHARNLNTAHNTFRYEFRYRGEFSSGDFFKTRVGKHWVSHEDELLYLFQGGPLFSPPHRRQSFNLPADFRMRDIMSTLWTNFAATGNPTPDDSLGFTWEPSTEDNLQYLALILRPTMEADQRQEVRKFFASLPTKDNVILSGDRVHDALQQEDQLRKTQDEL
nr:juvenile hormone esterase-like [Procambarus clarkii]